MNWKYWVLGVIWGYIIFTWHVWFPVGKWYFGRQSFFSWLSLTLLSLSSQPINCLLLLALFSWCHLLIFIPTTSILFEGLINSFWNFYLMDSFSLIISATDPFWGQFNTVRTEFLSIIFISHHCQRSWIWNSQFNM